MSGTAFSTCYPYLFVSAMWQAIRQALPTVEVKGCVFHWTQRVYRKITTLGLSSAYMQKKDKYVFMRKLMALPFLPHEHILPAFHKLSEQASALAQEPLPELINYISCTWMYSSIWKPHQWSVYNETVRTNNEVEGRSNCQILISVWFI